MTTVYTSISPDERPDGRATDEMRNVRITKNYLGLETGVLTEFGNTKVLCSATFLPKAPAWLNPESHGWVTAEYSMLPQATPDRNRRESVAGKISGRTHEISRLIGRSLRSVVNLDNIKGLSIAIDCDVLRADGGTRTASITGAYVALRMLVEKAISEGIIVGKTVDDIITDSVSAVSVGIVDGIAKLDLEYTEDSRADTDMNVIMSGNGNFIEIQGTAERHPFDRKKLDELLALAEKGCRKITEIQNM